ncbi:nucleotidyltransferase family protein, partial [candidate division WOR-3 bacterium]|nr:nucleotidyltransferase family protein [candidate division WOR-3 bacterium]
EDLLLHLCLHACCRDSLSGGLRPLCDITETIRRFGGELDWAQVSERARVWGVARHVALTLCLAEELLGAGVPKEILDRLVPEGIVQRIKEQAKESVLRAACDSGLMPFFSHRGARTLGEKVRFFRERVVLSREEMAAMYPASVGSSCPYIYYALRLRDVVRTYLRYETRRTRLKAGVDGRGQGASFLDWLNSGKS